MVAPALNGRVGSDAEYHGVLSDKKNPARSIDICDFQGPYMYINNYPGGTYQYIESGPNIYQ